MLREINSNVRQMIFAYNFSLSDKAIERLNLIRFVAFPAH